jgi:hypothetical protein
LELTAQVSLLAAAAYVNIFRMRSDDTFEADASLWCKWGKSVSADLRGQSYVKF